MPVHRLNNGVDLFEPQEGQCSIATFEAHNGVERVTIAVEDFTAESTEISGFTTTREQALAFAKELVAFLEADST